MRGVSTDIRGEWLVGILDAIRREFGWSFPHETPDDSGLPDMPAGSRTPLSKTPVRRSLTAEEAQKIAAQQAAYDSAVSR